MKNKIRRQSVCAPMRPFTEKFADPSTLGHDQAVEPKKMALDKAPKLRKTRDLTDSLVGGFPEQRILTVGA